MTIGDNSKLQRRRLIAGAVILALAFTALRLTFHYSAEKDKDEKRFETRATELTNSLRESIRVRLSALTRAQTPLGALTKLDRHQFAAVARQILRDDPSVLSLQWVPRVWDRERSSFETEARYSAPGFRISQAGSSGGVYVTAEQRESYFPLFHIEPSLEVDNPRLGFDFGSDPLYVDPLRSAMDDADTRLTSASETVNVEPPRTTITAFAPVFSNGDLPEGVATRRRQLAGFVVALYDVSALLEPFRQQMGQQIALRIFDKAANNKAIFLYAYNIGAARAPEKSPDTASYPLHTVRPLDTAGRQWELDFFALPAFLAPSSVDLWRIIMEGIALGAVMTLALVLASSPAPLVGTKDEAAERELTKTKSTDTPEIENTKRLLEKHLREKNEELLTTRKNLQTAANDKQLLKKENEALLQKVASLQKEKAGIEAANTQLDRHLAKASEEARSALLTGAATARDLESSLAGTTGAVQRLAKRVEELEAELSEQRAARETAEEERNQADQLSRELEEERKILQRALEEREELLYQNGSRTESAGEHPFSDMEGAMGLQQESMEALQKELEELRRLSEQQRDIQGDLERKVAERSAALAASEARSHALVQLTPVGIFYADLEGRFVYVNERFLQLSDLALDETRGEGWLSAVHADDRTELFRSWHKAVRERSRFIAEFRYVHKDGNCRLVHAEAVFEHGEAGGSYVGTVLDITPGSDVEEAKL